MSLPLPLSLPLYLQISLSSPFQQWDTHDQLAISFVTCELYASWISVYLLCVYIPVIKTHLGHKRRRSYICPVRAVACVIACSFSLDHFPSGFIPPIPFTFLCSHSHFHKLIAFLPTFSPFPLNIAQFTATHRRKSLTEFHKYSSSLVTGKNAK